MALEQAPALTVSERWDAGVAIATVRGEIDITTVVIRSPQRRVRQLFKITGLDSVIAIE